MSFLTATDRTDVDQIPCRFGFMCQRPDCVYVHPPLMKMVSQVQKPGKLRMPFQKGVKPGDLPAQVPDGSQN